MLQLFAFSSATHRPRRWWQYISLAVVTLLLCVACNGSQQANNANGNASLTVANSPWPGFVAQFIADEKGFYDEEGITIKEQHIMVATDVNTALLTDKVDLAWTGVPDMVVMANSDPSLRLIAVSDYSDGADGILVKDVSTPEDMIGKTIAWEELPLQSLLLQGYLKDSGVSINDLNLTVMGAADAATAFANDKVDVAITFEPWLSSAVEDGKGDLVFTSEGTNLIAGGLVGKTSVIESRRTEIEAYLRALEKGFDFYESNREEALEIVASKLELDPEELPPILDKVRLFKPSEHQSVVFNDQNSLNIMDSIDFAAEVGKEMDIVNDDVDPSKLYDSSFTEPISS